MNKVQFSAPIKEFDGSDAMTDDPRGMPEAIHKVLRAHLDRANAPEALLAVFDEFIKPKRTLTLADVCLRALNSGPPSKHVDIKESVSRFELQRKIIAAEKSLTPLELDSDAQKLIKDGLQHAGLTPWTVGQAAEMVEGKDAAEPAAKAEPKPRPPRAKPNGQEARPQA